MRYYRTGRVILCLFVFMLMAVQAGKATNQEMLHDCPQPTDHPAPIFAYRYEAGEDLAEKWNSQILNYLNITGSSDGLEAAILAAQPDPDVQPTLTVEIIEDDITGDGEDDLLLNLNLAWGAGYNRVLALYGCADQEYELSGGIVGGDFYDSRANRPPTLLAAVEDINANGRPEIISREITVTQKFLEAVRIYEWSGEMLAQTFDSGYSLGLSGDIRIENFDDDPQTLELLIADSYGYGEGIALATIEISRHRPVTVVYAWDGESYMRLCRYFTDEPVTLFETLHSAEVYRACGDLDNALRSYQRMIDDPTLQSWELVFNADPDAPDPDTYTSRVERAYLTAFAYYRIAQVHLAMGDPEAANDVAAQAQEAFTAGVHGHQYAAMTAALVNDFGTSGDLPGACAAAEKALELVHVSGADPGIDPELKYYDWQLGYGFYYYSGFNYSSDPHDMFAVPDDIASIISIPVCL